MERIKQPLKEFINFNHCMLQIGMLAIKEAIYIGDDALDCFGPDSPEDAAIPSTLGQLRGAA